MGYTGDLQNNGGGSWNKYRNITITAPAQLLPNGYSVKFVATGADAAAIFNASQADKDDVRLEHNITAPATTTLNGAITATQTTITLTSITGYPSTGMVIVDNERIAYKGISGNVLQNCVRGASGSTAAAHNSGETVTYVKEMERHVETFTSSNVTIWFKLRADIAATTADTNYRLHYGNSLAGAAPTTIDNVFAKDYGEAGLVGLWHLDEGVGLPQDGSGNGNHAISNTGIWQTTDGGKWDGQAATFSKGSHLSCVGSSQYMETTNNINITGNASRSVEWYSNGVVNQSGMWFWGGEGAGNRFGTMIYNNHWYFWGVGIGDFDTGVIPTSGWHQHVLTYNGTNLIWYLDGVSIGTATKALATLASHFFIGKASVDNYYGNGLLDEFRIYNRVLTADEINAHYKRRMWVAGDTVAIDGNFAVAGDEQSIAPPERTISVKFIAS